MTSSKYERDSENRLLRHANITCAFADVFTMILRAVERLNDKKKQNYKYKNKSVVVIIEQPIELP